MIYVLPKKKKEKKKGKEKEKYQKKSYGSWFEITNVLRKSRIDPISTG